MLCVNQPCCFNYFFACLVNLTALNFQAELLLTGSCSAAIWLNLKSPRSARYLWNVLGHLIKATHPSVFLFLSYLSEGQREIKHRVTAPGKSQVPGAVSSSGGKNPAHCKVHSSFFFFFFFFNPGDPGNHPGEGSFLQKLQDPLGTHPCPKSMWDVLWRNKVP